MNIVTNVVDRNNHMYIVMKRARFSHVVLPRLFLNYSNIRDFTINVGHTKYQ